MGDHHAADRWRSRPVLAGLTRGALLGVPLSAALLVVRALHHFVLGSTGPWLRLGLSAVVGITVALLTERATRRFLPLPALLRMGMLFPGRAPSRLMVARRASSASELRRLLEARDPDPQQAATTMMALIGALAAHDKRSRGHCERVRLFTDLVAAELSLSRGERDRMCWAALLHDVGKLEITSAILNKSAALNASEWQRMRRHPADGARLCASLLDWLGPSGRGILEHHEQYDGTGYPLGLAGHQISLAGRVIAVVDAYETMTAARPYKKPVTTRVAREELAACSSTQFDPVIVKAFLAVSVPRMLWATGPLSLLTHLPYLREVQLAGTQVASVSAGTAVQLAGATAVAVGTAIAPVPATAAADMVPLTHNAVHQQVSAVAHNVTRIPVSVTGVAVGLGPVRRQSTERTVSHGAAKPTSKSSSDTDSEPTVDAEPTVEAEPTVPAEHRSDGRHRSDGGHGSDGKHDGSHGSDGKHDGSHGSDGRHGSDGKDGSTAKRKSTRRQRESTTRQQRRGSARTTTRDGT